MASLPTGRRRRPATVSRPTGSAPRLRWPAAPGRGGRGLTGSRRPGYLPALEGHRPAGASNPPAPADKPPALAGKTPALTATGQHPQPTGELSRQPGLFCEVWGQNSLSSFLLARKRAWGLSRPRGSRPGCPGDCGLNSLPIPGGGPDGGTGRTHDAGIPPARTRGRAPRLRRGSYLPETRAAR
jgi:hypothetical protein